MTPDEFVTEDAVNVGWAAIYTTASPQEVRSALTAAGPLIAAEALRWAADRLDTADCGNDWCGNTEPHVSYDVDSSERDHGCVDPATGLHRLADLLAPDPDGAL